MTITPKDLQKLAQLAYLDTDTEVTSKLNHEINQIMDFVDQLRATKTTGVAPLFHPLAQEQRLRPDEITEASCLAELEEIAPLFEENLYLVPQVIEQGKS